MTRLFKLALFPLIILALSQNANAQDRVGVAGVAYVGDNDFYGPTLAVSGSLGVEHNLLGVSVRSDVSKYSVNLGGQFGFGKSWLRVGAGAFYGFNKNLDHVYFLAGTSEIIGAQVSLRYGRMDRVTVLGGRRYIDLSVGKKFKF